MTGPARSRRPRPRRDAPQNDLPPLDPPSQDPPSLDARSLRSASATLADADPALAAVHRRLGPPPLWGRPPTYGTLVRIVLEQNVSLASAKSTFDRLGEACQFRVNAKRVLRLGEPGLRRIGFSRQKAGYTVALAEQVRGRRLGIASLRGLSDDDVLERLTSHRGVGRWTAEIFLLMALRRPDVFPLGDLALVKGACELDGREYPDRESLETRAERWRPYRSVAARMIWQLYLDNRRRKLP